MNLRVTHELSPLKKNFPCARHCPFKARKGFHQRRTEGIALPVCLRLVFFRAGGGQAAGRDEYTEAGGARWL